MEVTLLFHVKYGCYRAQEVQVVNVLKEANHYMSIGDQFIITDYHMSTYLNPDCI